MPAIDFDSYRAKVCIYGMNLIVKYMLNFQITVAGMVDNFAAKYAALDIPYPSDQV